MMDNVDEDGCLIPDSRNILICHLPSSDSTPDVGPVDDSVETSGKDEAPSEPCDGGDAKKEGSCSSVGSDELSHWCDPEVLKSVSEVARRMQRTEMAPFPRWTPLPLTPRTCDKPSMGEEEPEWLTYPPPEEDALFTSLISNGTVVERLPGILTPDVLGELASQNVRLKGRRGSMMLRTYGPGKVRAGPWVLDLHTFDRGCYDAALHTTGTLRRPNARRR